MRDSRRRAAPPSRRQAARWLECSSNFNLGVLRWTWRVNFDGYGALGTDRYPPFTLGAAPDYPARLEIDYPEDQATGQKLLSAWLAGIPQYVIACILGGGAGIAWAAEHSLFTRLIGVLVLVAAIALAVNGDYRAASSITSSASTAGSSASSPTGH